MTNRFFKVTIHGTTTQDVIVNASNQELAEEVAIGVAEGAVGLDIIDPDGANVVWVSEDPELSEDGRVWIAAEDVEAVQSCVNARQHPFEI